MEDLLKVGVITTTHGIRGGSKKYILPQMQTDFWIWNMFCLTQAEKKESLK